MLQSKKSVEGITITGFSDIEGKLDKTSQLKLAERMLKAAEPRLLQELGGRMLAHKGTLQKSMRSTGPKQNSSGGWYLAYRATTGNEKAGEISNQEKMIFLTNRQFVAERKTKDGKTIRSYVIPADDVIGKTIEKIEPMVMYAMQTKFNEALDEIWED